MPVLLWDRERGDQRVFNQVPGYEKWLNQEAPRLINTVEMEPLWTHLVSLEVVDKAKRARIEVGY